MVTRYLGLFLAGFIGVINLQYASAETLKFHPSIGIGSIREEVKRYEPTWKSLDQRPIPQWFQVVC
jgi:hypothetical protein